MNNCILQHPLQLEGGPAGCSSSVQSAENCMECVLKVLRIALSC